MSDDKCSMCGGKGERVCPACNGLRELSKSDGAKKSWEPCARCGGSGVITCPKCQGSGKA